MINGHAHHQPDRRAVAKSDSVRRLVKDFIAAVDVAEDPGTVTLSIELVLVDGWPVSESMQARTARHRKKAA